MKHQFSVKLVVLNLVVWSLFSLKLLVTKVEQARFMYQHNELITLVNSFNNYDEYQQNLPLMAGKMTPAIIALVCPIIPADMLGNFPEIVISNVNTIKTGNQTNQTRQLLTEFCFEIQNHARFIQRIATTYQKQDDKWLMVAYQFVI